MRCCWVKGIRHYICLVNVTISVFRWRVRYGTNQGIKTCDTIAKQHMRSQVRLRLRRNCKFYSYFDARPSCGFFALCVCACWHVWTKKNRKSAVKESEHLAYEACFVFDVLSKWIFCFLGLACRLFSAKIAVGLILMKKI